MCGAVLCAKHLISLCFISAIWLSELYVAYVMRSDAVASVHAGINS